MLTNSLQSRYQGLTWLKPYLKAKYHRVASRRGRKRAIIAVGHKILQNEISDALNQRGIFLKVL